MEKLQNQMKEGNQCSVLGLGVTLRQTALTVLPRHLLLRLSAAKAAPTPRLHERHVRWSVDAERQWCAVKRERMGLPQSNAF